MDKIRFIALAVANITGIIMMLSEGSQYFWANIAGLMIFGLTSWRLGLFDSPHKS